MMSNKKLGKIGMPKATEILQQLGFEVDRDEWIESCYDVVAGKQELAGTGDKKLPIVGDEISKAWGKEYVIAANPKFRSKIIRIKVGSVTSMHFHANKHETIYVMSGKYVAWFIDKKTAEKQELLLSPGDVFINDPFQPHQIKCIQKGELLEVSDTDDHLDIYRIAPGEGQKVYK